MKCIFVESRGGDPEQDYSQQFPNGYGVKDWLYEAVFREMDSEYPSLALFQWQSQWVVLVVALPSIRYDFRNRNIRNSVAWLCDDQRKAKMIATKALLDWKGLAAMVGETIELDPSNPKIGWKVDCHKIKNVCETIFSEMSSVSSSEKFFDTREQWPYDSRASEDTDLPLGPGSAEWLKLAQELMKYTIPEKDGYYIVVTHNPKTTESLKRFQSECVRLLSGDGAASIIGRIARQSNVSHACETEKFQKTAKREDKPAQAYSHGGPVMKRGNFPNVPTKSLTAMIVIFLTIGVVAYRCSSKKKPEISEVRFERETDGGIPHLTIKFDIPMKQDNFPKLQISPKNDWNRRTIKWLDNRTLSVEITPPEEFEVLISDAVSQEGDRLERWEKPVQLETSESFPLLPKQEPIK